jgi:UDP:flavonoid glycosyltransferase YjiC (YdhE family)
MRILFASTRSAGHFNPLVPFAHAVLRAGHEVLVSAPEACRVHVARAGLPFVAHGDCSRAEVEAVRERGRGLSLEEQNRLTRECTPAPRCRG